ncbi:MAG: Right handed beta helix region [Verrucomicrobia bacterium]|nr:MAG: Right handed beta helix region [Verrucomicrobiota bacterium]
MKRTLPFITTLLIQSTLPIYGVDLPTPITPHSCESIYSPHPHFRWKRESDVKIDDIHQIQIARDESFERLVCDDRLEVVSRFVPVNSLSPAKYWWRVRRGEGDWSQAAPFKVQAPEHAFAIHAGSDAETVARVLQNAATHCPARVDFEPGDYRLAAKDGKSLVTLVKAHDLIIDGHGARLTLAGTLLVLNDCQRVTLAHFTITADRPGHTLVRVVKKDPANEQLIVKPEPGYDPDVPRYFDMTGSGGSFLGCMDSKYHGRYIPGGGISARTVKIQPAKDEPETFVFSPVKAATLDLFPIGAVAVATSYHWQWIQMNRTEECTFNDVTVTDLPGAFCGGSNNSARSYLACKVKPRTPQDYFGGHAATGSGRIGEWIEGCQFECLPDDGPAEQSFRQTIKGVYEMDTVVLSGTAIREGDRVALVNGRTGRGVSTLARSVKAGSVQLDRPFGELAAAIGYDPSGDLKNVFLYCDAPSNEDFVYRRNRTVGGRAHGVKFNGTRAWIADNHFENINGNAVLAGYTSEVSGHGARDVVVSGNSIVRCGWTPINVWSTSGLGGNIRIRNNRITETRDAAIAIKGCDGVSISGNTFLSSTPPAQGAWITAEKTRNVVTSGNTYPGDVPELKTASPSK